MKKLFLYLAILSQIFGCSKKATKYDSDFLSGDFYSFYLKIDKLEKIKDSKQLVFVPNDAPASFMHIKTEEGYKYTINYAGSLGKRSIRYFVNQNNIYIEDINIGYNKILNYEGDTTKLCIIKQDTTKYFIKDSHLVKYWTPSNEILGDRQITTGVINKSNDLLSHLEKVKSNSGL